MASLARERTARYDRSGRSRPGHRLRRPRPPEALGGAIRGEASVAPGCCWPEVPQLADAGQRARFRVPPAKYLRQLRRRPECRDACAGLCASAPAPEAWDEARRDAYARTE